jgi:O-antigen ligase
MAGWLLVAGVLYVPWHDGGLAPLATVIASSAVFIATLPWLWGHALGKTLPRLPLACLACTALLLLQGWWMVINAHQTYDPVTHELFPVSSVWGAAPGSADAKTSETSALNASSMLLALCMACDLSRYAKWRKRFVGAIAINGALVAAAGLFRDTTGVELPWGSADRLHQGTPFGPFSYHGNAGSFLIVCLPSAFALLLNTWQRGHRTWKVVLAGLPLPLIVAGSIVNISRAAQAITVLLTVGLMAWAIWQAQHGNDDASEDEPKAWRRLGWTLVLPAIVLAAMVAGAMATTANRWATLPKQLGTKNDRLIMWQVCLHWLGDAGPMGYGPGTYKLLYPTTPRELLKELYPRWIVHTHNPGGPVSIWSNVHNDYLQLAFEWGWLGGAAWAVLLVGGVACAAWGAGRRYRLPSDRTIVVCAGFAVAGVMLHAMVDFPLQVLSLQMYAGILLGLAWGSRNWAVETHDRPVAVREDASAESFKYN